MQKLLDAAQLSSEGYVVTELKYWDEEGIIEVWATCPWFSEGEDPIEINENILNLSESKYEETTDYWLNCCLSLKEYYHWLLWCGVDELIDFDAL